MSGLQDVIYLIGLIIFIVMLVEVWRSPLNLGPKIGWTVFSLIFTLIALIVWFAYGRRRAYNRA